MALGTAAGVQSSRGWVSATRIVEGSEGRDGERSFAKRAPKAEPAGPTGENRGASGTGLAARTGAAAGTAERARVSLPVLRAPRRCRSGCPVRVGGPGEGAPDLAALYSLFRMYLLDYRVDLTLPSGHAAGRARHGAQDLSGHRPIADGCGRTSTGCSGKWRA